MSLFGKKKSFREIMNEFEEAYGDLNRQAKLLGKAAKMAKTDSEKMEAMIQFNTLKEKMNR